MKQLEPMNEAEVFDLLFGSERRFRMRIAIRIDDEERASLATALRAYAQEIIRLDHAKAVAFFELAETIDTAYPRTLS